MVKALIEIKQLSTSFNSAGDYYAAVDNVSLSISHNETLAIVGESGCGKSALALAIMGLHDARTTRITGEINFQGLPLLQQSIEQLNRLRGDAISLIFQDPLTALNPLMTVGQQIAENLQLHTNLTGEVVRQRVYQLLEQVGLSQPRRLYQQYPHELSGGMRQRVVIAIAIVNNPALIIADEPTTALDVTIQAQIIDLLQTIKADYQSSVLLITHDLGVVAEMADRVAVMYAGQIVELATVDDLFKRPHHPYTRSLFASMPQFNTAQALLRVIEGAVPSLAAVDRQSCRFADRIPWIPASAHEPNPALHEVRPNHYVRCTCWRTFHFREEGGKADVIHTAQ